MTLGRWTPARVIHLASAAEVEAVVAAMNALPAITQVVRASESLDEEMIDDGQDPDAETFALKSLAVHHALEALKRELV